MLFYKTSSGGLVYPGDMFMDFLNSAFSCVALDSAKNSIEL